MREFTADSTLVSCTARGQDARTKNIDSNFGVSEVQNFIIC